VIRIATLPIWIQLLAPIWEVPIRKVIKLAGKRIDIKRKGP